MGRWLFPIYGEVPAEGGGWGWRRGSSPFMGRWLFPIYGEVPAEGGGWGWRRGSSPFMGSWLFPIYGEVPAEGGGWGWRRGADARCCGFGTDAIRIAKLPPLQMVFAVEGPS